MFLLAWLGSYLRNLVGICPTWRDLVCIRLWLCALLVFYSLGLVLIRATWLVFARHGVTWLSLDSSYLRYLVFIRWAWFLFAPLRLYLHDDLARLGFH